MKKAINHLADNEIPRPKRAGYQNRFYLNQLEPTLTFLLDNHHIMLTARVLDGT
jgi:hypothetical protein